MATTPLLLGAAGWFGCLPRGENELRRLSDEGADGGIQLQEAGSPDARGSLPPLDPHALLALSPARGPFTGGQRTLLRGNGFTGELRVWFGDVELARDSVLPVDPGRAQVVAPPGEPGFVDVTVQNGDDASTRRTLTSAYHYEPFYLEPDTGPVSGGTVVTLRGRGTTWDATTTVTIDRQPCELAGPVTATELRCRTPRGTPGSKAVRVGTAEDAADVLDGFSYVDSDNGFRGGLSGSALASELRVIVLSDLGGQPLPGATVIVGEELESALVQKTDRSGVTVFSQAELGPTRTVTVANKCFQPTTFVDVPVDTVTVYLDPILSPSCIEELSGELPLPPAGGSSGYAATVQGELLWPSRTEFDRSGWTNVPAPMGADERRVAYVLPLASSPAERFQLPASYRAITPESGGERGFEFRLTVSPGNLSLYAVAGIENRSVDPPLFIAYAMGVIKGVATAPAETTSEVFIPIDVALDRALRLDVEPPRSTARGPDRLEASVSLRVGELGYAPVPAGQLSRMLPIAAPVEFVGLPSLGGSLRNAEYVANARAVTGPSGGLPRSVVGYVTSSVPGSTLLIDEFVQVPVLTTPALNEAWDGQRLALQMAPGGADIDLLLFEIESGGGASTWKVVAPGTRRELLLPDLAELGSELALKRGTLTVRVSAASILDFQYEALRYRALRTSGWTSHAVDAFQARY